MGRFCAQVVGRAPSGGKDDRTRESASLTRDLVLTYLTGALLVFGHEARASAFGMSNVQVEDPQRRGPGQ